MSVPNRQPAGIPTGGQFAPDVRARAAVDLDHAAPGDAERERAREAAQHAADSWERSDTDGFLSQHANSLSAQQHRLQAEIDDAEGLSSFPALADTDGNLVPAKLVHTRYGSAWGLLSDPDDPQSQFTGFVNTSKAATPEKRAAALAGKGYQVVTVRAPARAVLAGGGQGLGGMLGVHAAVVRADGGFSRTAEIVHEHDVPAPRRE